ncbi:MAG: hypothetical protein IT245_04135 [Bacteroidia bacterium]|nr:hypothetical protein [Bacteroidia bacterium]
MKNLQFLFVGFFLGSLHLSAQDFNFNQYQYRFQKFKGLSTYYDLSGNGNLFKDKSTDISPYSPTTTLKYSKPNFSSIGNFQLSYFQNINTQKLQQLLTFDANFNYNFLLQNQSRYYNNGNSVEQLHQNYRSTNIQGIVNVNLINRDYSPSNSFKLYGVTAQSQWNNMPVKSKFEDTVGQWDLYSRNASFLFNTLNLNIGAGKGRLEYVSDPIMTQFLILDLKKNAGIGEVSAAQLENIAKGITRIRNTRFIDFRFKLIDQLEMLDSVLKTNGVESLNSSRYFTTLYDNWLYATRFQRYSGRRWTYYVDESINVNRDKNLIETPGNSGMFSKNDFLRLKNGLVVEYSKSTQKSLKVQVAWDFKASAYYLIENLISRSVYSTTSNTPQTNDSETKSQILQANLQANYSFLFQPNTRTFFQFFSGVSVNAQNMFKQENTSFIDPKAKEITGFLNVGANYFKFMNARWFYSIGATYSSFVGQRQSNYVLNSVNLDRNTTQYNSLNLGIGFTARLSYALF